MTWAGTGANPPARNNLTIGVAGDITADELGPALDEVFSPLAMSRTSICRRRHRATARL
ncbi:MAG: hypothetical protein R3D03_01650 [Geminicoccaceae bacterium]